MKRRVLFWMLAPVALLLVIGTALLATGFKLVSTQGGTLWLMQRVFPTDNTLLSWETLHGTLREGIDVTGLTITQGHTRITADNVSGKWDLLSIFGGQFEIKQLHIRQLVIVSDNPEETPQDAPWPELGSPLPINIEDVSVDPIIFRSATTEYQIDAINFSGNIGSLQTRLKNLSLRQGHSTLQISGRLGAHPPYSMNLGVNWETQSDDGTHYQGTGKLAGNLIQLQLNHRLKTPLQITTSGSVTPGYNPDKVALDSSTLTAALTSRWHLDNAPVPALDKQISSTGQLTLTGSLASYRLDGHFDLSSSDIDNLPKQSVAFTATGNQSQLDFDHLAITSEAASIQGGGLVSWAAVANWNLTLQGERINPGYFWPDYAGQIQADVHSRGSLTPAGLSVETRINSLTGTLRGYPLSLTGALDYSAGVFSTPGLTLVQGKNQLLLSAAFDTELNAHWTLKADDLAAFYPGLKGRIDSRGTLTGTVQAPLINASLTGQDLAFENFSATTIEARIDAANSDAHHLSIGVSDLITGTQKPLSLTLLGDGNPSLHGYSLAARQEGLSLTVKGKGRWHSPQWQSEITTSVIDSDPFGTWTLADSVQIVVQKDQLGITAACWANNPSQICAEVSYATGSGLNVTGKIDALGLAIFEPWLPPGTQIEGELNGALALSGALNNLEGKFDLSANAGKLTLTTDEKEPQYLVFKGVGVKGRLDKSIMQINATGQLLETGFIESSLVWPINQPNAPLSGTLRLRFGELAWLAPFLAFVSDLDGQADATLQLAGTVNQPLLTGSLHFNEMFAFVPRLGINLKNGQLALERQDQDDWQISGMLESGEGSVQLGGTATFKSLTDWQSRLTIDGQQLHTLGLETITADINPQLVIQADPDKLRVQGTIEIPSAQVRIKELSPSALEVSSDEIIVDQPRSAQSPKSRLAIFTDINLLLGEQIAFKGFGITGGLSGNLRLREQPEKPLRIDGIVTIADGSYKAYGQKLAIDPGRLIFQGAPDNPVIDVRASRKVGTTLVGIQIGGTAQALASTLYSVPVQSPTETIALLITGKSLSQSTATDANMLLGAVTSLGISQSAQLTQHLQRALGLDVLTLSSESGMEQSAVTIGKYLTPKLFMSYVQALLAPDASVNLEYSLSDRFKVKAGSGTSQSMDIIYRIEQ